MGKEQLMRDNALGLDEPFGFRCNGCSDCCDEVAAQLNPLDILRASAHLELAPNEFVDEYCDFYIGDNTKMPIFALWCDPDSGRCMLFDEDGCTIHPVKPASCALYPLARGRGEDGRFVYFHTGEVCGGYVENQTVRQWLEAQNLLSGEAFSLFWMDAVDEVGTLLREFWKRESPDELMGEVYHNTGALLYLEYDLDGELIPQIERNVAEVKAYLVATLAENAGGTAPV